MAEVEILDRLINQDRAKSFFKEVVKRKRTGSYMLIGPQGVGKRTAALLFASALNNGREDILKLQNPDVSIIFPVRSDKLIYERMERYKFGEISPRPSLEEIIPIKRIRELREELMYPPRTLPYRVIIMVNIERMRIEASNAFLKALEEPGEKTVFILTTSNPFFIPSTIRSRCQIVRFSKIPEKLIQDFLISKGVEHQSAKKASILADGSLKNAFDFLKDPKNYFSADGLWIFERLPVPDHELVDFVERIENSLEKLIRTFRFLYHQTLKYKKGVEEPPFFSEIIKRKSSKIYEEEILQDLRLLEEYEQRLAYHPNRRLFLLSLLMGLH